MKQALCEEEGLRVRLQLHCILTLRNREGVERWSKHHNMMCSVFELFPPGFNCKFMHVSLKYLSHQVCDIQQRQKQT